MWQTVLDTVFPRRSLTNEWGTWITEAERRQLRTHPECIGTSALQAKGLMSLDRLVAASNYDASPMLQLAIRRFKYGRITALAEDLGKLLTESTPLLAQTNPAPVLCPVPLHWSRHFQRGFNQSMLLAQIVGRTWGWRIDPCLKRVRSTGSQAKRNREERLTSMEDAFIFSGIFAPKIVILIDDVATTGTTVDACAAALKRAGCEHVEALVLAMG
jgi:ComF family protein